MKTYLFDFDGTLVDSMPTYGSIMLRILDEEGIAYGDDIIKIITPLGLKGAAEHFIGMGVQRSTEEIIQLYLEYAVEAYTNDVPAKNNVAVVLQTLKRRGAGLHVLTASPHSTLDPCLKRLGLYDIFDNVWSCEDFKTTKADPEIYRLAAQKIGADVTDVLFLDDNYNADKTAKEAGMQVCGVYDVSSAEYTDEIKSVTDYYITDFSELLDI